MHCPHKSVNQTSLTRRYWCLAATDAERSWRAANRPRCSRLAQRQADESGLRNVPALSARFHHSESGALIDSSLRIICESYGNAENVFLRMRSFLSICDSKRNFPFLVILRIFYHIHLEWLDLCVRFSLFR